MPDAGQPNRTQGIAGDHLRSFVERIERLREEVKALNHDVSDVYGEAKAMGFDVKIMKLLIAERTKAAHDLAEQQELLDIYRNAVGGR